MRVYISADIEGVSGVVHSEHTLRDGREHDYARMLMTEEVNACVLGALDAGAEKIVVNDSHGTMRNIYHEKLHTKAELILGTPKRLAMMEGIATDFDAVLFVGYHTRMGTNGVLNHTFNGRVIRTVSVNGVELGEFGLNALVAGDFDVPVVFASGCNLLAKEAIACIPEIHQTIVKETINRTTALNIHPIKARELIREGTKKALQNYKKVKPFTMTAPYTINIEFINTGFADAVEILPFTQRTGPLTVSYEGSNIIECYQLIRSSIMIAGSVS
ncbi:M55 family metallopeptidase [Filibacter tadaridae]|uniref:D-aminopeptidase n=1 Tax=Filibacter tadaridae TaxID=2483811 RepID=A0A3P5XIU2_9BACL|nr:M55 family metallopeptidase [Filibacter tadaridae]VDC27583.1 D-aminopeptidase [Filibacter tadaridae]